MATVTAKTAHTVPMRDGSHRVVQRGQVVDLDQTSEAYQESLKSDYGKNLVEKGGKAEDADVVAPEGLLVDPGEVTKARLDLSPEERNGSDLTPATSVPPRLDDGRTLPESGVDLEADKRFAEGSADTSEDAVDMGVQRAQEAEGLPKRRGGGRKAKETLDPAKGDPEDTTVDTGDGGKVGGSK